MNPLLLLLLLAVAGLLVYAFSGNQKASTIGIVMFAGAYLAICLDAGHVMAVLR